MSQPIYLRPQGFLYGTSARQAVDQGIAGLLAGSEIAFQSVQILSRDIDEAGSLHPYREIALSKEHVLTRQLDRIFRPRDEIAGIDLSRPTIMGIVNTTPDSFSDGGEYFDPTNAIAHGRQLAAKGAHILDIGGESTRPGAQEVVVEEEISRTIPVVDALSSEGYCVSIDTRKSSVMSAAHKAGAAIINDVSALQFDQNSARVATEAACPVVLMHAQGLPENMQDNPDYGHVVLDIYDALSALITSAEKAGVKRQHIIADPGIGFGKTYRHNLEIMDHLSLYHALGVPLLVGASRKRFLGELTGEQDAKKRLSASVAAALCAVHQGVQIIRVHDVLETVQAIKVVKTIQTR